MMTIDTARLRLRGFTISDAPVVQRLAGDRRVSKMTESIPYPYKAGMAEEWISSHKSLWENLSCAPFAVEEMTSGELIGCIGLSINKKHKRASLGYWIGFEYWRRGYCTEACRAVLDYGFSSLGLKRIEAIHLSINPASGAVMRKLGMSHEGTMKSYVVSDDGNGNMELYAIIANNRQSSEN